MKGMKFRVVGSPLFLDTFSALGANPTQMSWADAQPALASGAVDGQENPLAVFNAAKLHTVGQKHLTLWHYMSDPLIFVANKDVWASWSAADREAVRQAAIQAGKENIEKARKGITAADPALLKQIEGNGVALVTPTAEERAAFVAATRQVYEKVDQDGRCRTGEEGRNLNCQALKTRRGRTKRSVPRCASSAPSWPGRWGCSASSPWATWRCATSPTFPSPSPRKSPSS
jgi:TRAP-type C4-dicarboxylate transport system substrate-binding protein